MPSRDDNIEIKSLADFKNLVESGGTPTGLVESIGYVYWSAEALWFERMNADHPWDMPVYHQVDSPMAAENQHHLIFSVIAHTMKVMSPADLKQYDINLYHAYYGYLVSELVDMPADALRMSHFDPRYNPPSRGNYSNDNGLLRMGNDINEAIGAPLGMAELLTSNKMLGRIGGALTGVSILYNVDKGNYYSAGGQTLLFVASQLSSTINIGVDIISLLAWLNNTRYIAEQKAQDYAREYFRWRNEYEKEKGRTNPNERLKAEYAKQADNNLMLFKQCMDKLGIPIPPQITQFE